MKAADPPRPGPIPHGLHEGFTELINMCWGADPFIRPTSAHVVEFLETSPLLSAARRKAVLMTPDRIPSVDPPGGAAFGGLDVAMDGFAQGRPVRGREASHGAPSHGMDIDIHVSRGRRGSGERAGRGVLAGRHVRLTASEWDMDSILDGDRDASQQPPMMIPGALPSRTQSGGDLSPLV